MIIENSAKLRPTSFNIVMFSSKNSQPAIVKVITLKKDRSDCDIFEAERVGEKV